MEHVFGDTILHDVSSRHIQFKDHNEVMGKISTPIEGNGLLENPVVAEGGIEN